MQKLTQDQWIQLDTMMRDVPDPNTTYTATGWHYQLMALLGQFGYRIPGRQAAFDKAEQLLSVGWKQ